MDDWKEEWEKEQGDQKAGNIFAAVLFGLVSLPFWFADVMCGIVVTAFWGIMFLVYWNSQPHTYEDFAERKKKEREEALRPKPGTQYYPRYYLPPVVEDGPECPMCGSKDVRELSGLDVDVDAVDTFIEEADGGMWPVCLHDYMCRRCGHKW